MPGISATDKATVIQRCHNLLKYRLSDLSDQVILVAVDEVPQARPKVCITVSMPGGQFDYSKQAGGASKVLHYQGTLSVSIWANNRLDRNGHDTEAILSDSSGLFRIWKRVLKALVGSYLNEGVEISGGSDPILIQACYAISDGSLNRINEESTGGSSHSANSRATMNLQFGVDFAVDLES